MTEYIKTMRRYVGHLPIMQVGASVAVIDGEGRFLLQKRTDNGQWGYHGGCVEPGETVEEAAKRELFEETGLLADGLELHGVYSGPGMFYIYPNGDETNIVDIVYICRSWHGDMRPQPGEVDELRWFCPEDFPPEEMISPPNRAFFREFRTKKDMS